MMRNDAQQLSLLLVEDSPADVYLVKEAIEEEGLPFHLEVAGDGEKAIHFLDRVDAGEGVAVPNLILLDISVPRRNGIEVLQRVRSSPRCGKVPVVMISSSDSPTERKRAFEMGATEYFRKPSTLADFMQLGKLVRRLHEEWSATAV